MNTNNSPNDTPPDEPDDTKENVSGISNDIKKDVNDTMPDISNDIKEDVNDITPDTSDDIKDNVRWQDQKDYTQLGYLPFHKALKYSKYSERHLRRLIADDLKSFGLNWKTTQEELARSTNRFKKVNEKKGVFGRILFEWEISQTWLDNKLKKRPDKIPDTVPDMSNDIIHDTENPPPDTKDPPPDITHPRAIETMEVDGIEYTKPHIREILESRKDQKEQNKIMVDLQKQVNTVMAMMNRTQQMLLGSGENKPKEKARENIEPVEN